MESNNNSKEINISENNKKILKSKELSFSEENLKNFKIKLTTFKNEEFSSINVPKNKDLVPGQYEGGIKIWECSLDLCSFLPNYIGWYDMKNLRVMELGCGHGLPSLYFLLKNCYVMFQDFNKEILERITYEYVNQIDKKYETNFAAKSAYIDGDWKDLYERIQANKFNFSGEGKESFFKDENSKKFDIIISADTLYNTENYEYLHENILKNINNPGVCFIASKKFYFGVGGGTSQFIDFVEQKGNFDIKCVKEINDGMSNIREILELRPKN